MRGSDREFFVFLFNIDVVNVMRESDHETLPTTDGTTISTRGVFDGFVKELVDGLEKPDEPFECSKFGMCDVVDSQTAETIGLIKLRVPARERGVDDSVNVLDGLFHKPATTLRAIPVVECSPETSLTEVLTKLDERDMHAVFTTCGDAFDEERAIITAEDILWYLCPLGDALREIVSFEPKDFNPVFESAKDTFLAVRQEHNLDLTTADIFWWMHRQSVNAVAFFESSFRVPGDTPLYGSVFVELSTRDLLDLTPENFHLIFESDPVSYIACKRRGVFVQTQQVAHDDRERGARAALSALADKNPSRLPKRFYVFQHDVVRAMTPLSLLTALLAVHARQ